MSGLENVDFTSKMNREVVEPTQTLEQLGIPCVRTHLYGHDLCVISITALGDGHSFSSNFPYHFPTFIISVLLYHI